VVGFFWFFVGVVFFFFFGFCFFFLVVVVGVSRGECVSVLLLLGFVCLVFGVCFGRFFYISSGWFVTGVFVVVGVFWLY